MDVDALAIYSIGAVSRMLGVPTATIRSWEERYGLVVPTRSSGGHRLYSRNHVEQLRFVLVQLEGGMQAADAHRLLAQRLAEGDSIALTDPRAGARITILLAERDPYAAEFTEYFLKTEGYDVLVARDAEQAQQGYEEGRPSVAVVDLLMSGGTGGKLCAKLKELGVASILAVSTLESREEALVNGADAFLQKPLDPLQLVSTVRDLLGTSAFLRAAVP